MRMFSFLKKSLKENIRDWKVLVITLVMAPIYVFITYFMFDNTNQSYRVIVSNNDRPVIMENGAGIHAGNDIIDRMKKLKHSDGKNVLIITYEKDEKKAEKLLKERSADLFLVIPEDFSKAIRENAESMGKLKINLGMVGDERNPMCQMAGIWVDTSVYEYVMAATGTDIPLSIERRTVDSSNAATQFGMYIPGLLAVSLLSLLFTAAATIVQEVDKGTIKRIKISKVKPVEFLSAISITQAFISIPVVLLTYMTAFSLGYRPQGSLVNVLTVGFISSFSIMAISLIIASFLSTVFELMTIGSFPYFILLFFSGAWFPMPGKNLFYIGNHPFAASDILPISHTVSAMNKILNYGFGLIDVLFELCCIVILTIIYFAIGVILFNRRHMRIA